MADTEQFVSGVLEKGGGLVRPILTPRSVMMMMMITMMIMMITMMMMMVITMMMMMSPGSCPPARGG